MKRNVFSSSMSMLSATLASKIREVTATSYAGQKESLEGTCRVSNSYQHRQLFTTLLFGNHEEGTHLMIVSFLATPHAEAHCLAG